MSFPTCVSRIPTKIGTERVTLIKQFIPETTIFEPDTGDPITVPEHYDYYVHGEIETLDQFDVMLFSWKGDLIPHLTQAQKDGLLLFMEDLKIKAEEEFLP